MKKLHSIYSAFLIVLVSFSSPASAQFSGKDSAILREAFLDSLQVGSTTKLKIHASVGCITIHDIDIIIQRQQKGYVANATYRFGSDNGEKWRKTVKQVKLSAAHLDTLRQIEQDMITAQKANDAAGEILTSPECAQWLGCTYIKGG